MHVVRDCAVATIYASGIVGLVLIIVKVLEVIA